MIQTNDSCYTLNPGLDVLYYPNWLGTQKSQKLLDEIKAFNWQHEYLHLFGKKILVPRKVIWIADPGKVYRYSGIAHSPKPWPKSVTLIRQKLATMNLNFNSVLGNFYKDGMDYMGWHRDNEAELGKQPTIASLSLGVERVFYFRHIKTKNKVKITLKPGSLLVMYGNSQEDWQHSLPKTKKVIHPRINLTFRTLLSDL